MPAAASRCCRSGSLQGTQCRVPRGAATLPHRLPLRFIPPAALRLRALPIHEGHGRPRSVRKSSRLREKYLFTELLLHEASSGRACWQRLPKTRTKKPRKEAGHKRSREQKTVHKENCARRRVCSRRESNPYGHFCPQDFKSCVSTYSTTRAVQI